MDEKDFLSPKVTQHSGHMIMTNVNKPSKIKYFNIDTRFQEEYPFLQCCVQINWVKKYKHKEYLLVCTKSNGCPYYNGVHEICKKK